MYCSGVRFNQGRKLSFTRFRGLGRFASAFMILSVLILPSSCGNKQKQEPFSSACNLHEDQRATLSGRWSATPVPMAVHTSDFSAGEAGEILAAIQTWNDFFSTSKGIVLFYGGRNNQMAEDPDQPPSVQCSQPIISGATYSNSIIIYKIRSGWHSNLPNVAALTTYCPVANGVLPAYKWAMMEMNFQNFWVANRNPDLQSVVLHELGHVLGVDHSCDGAKQGFPGCDGASSEYSDAVMAPTINANGDQKRDLKINDQDRANCLYGEGAF